MSDPSYENLFFLANLNGPDGALSYTPDKGSDDFAFVGNAQLDTAVKKFGTASMLGAGTGDHATHGSAGDYDFLHDNSTDWTIELFAQINVAAATGLIDTTQTVTGPEDASGFTCFVDASGVVIATIGNATTLVGFTDEPGFTAGSMHYIAIVYEMSVGAPRVYVNAVTGNGTPPIDFGPAHSSTSSQALHIGHYANIASYDISGNIDSVRVSKEALTISSVPTQEFTFEMPAVGLIESPLGLYGVQGYGFADASKLIAESPAQFVADLTGTPLRIPISSWQGTYQTDRPGYLQAVIPNSPDYEAAVANAITSGDEFVISRVFYVGGVAHYAEVARATVENASTYRGPYKATVVLAGYPARVAAPPAQVTRVLPNVRQWSSTSNGVYRARTDIDYYLRPGDVASVDGYDFTVTYITYYCPTGGDVYMDIGAR